MALFDPIFAVHAQHAMLRGLSAFKQPDAEERHGTG